MAARTGKEYLEGLKDDREVWIGKEKVDVLTHPAFQGSLKGMAGYFDWQHKFAEECLVKDEQSSQMMSASLLLPKNKQDLEARGRCYEQLAKYSYGMLGRTPDYCNTALAGYAARADMFIEGGHSDWATNIVNFHREVVEKDLSLTHTIIQPQPDKGQNDLAGINAEVALKVVERTKDYLVVRGAKILATLGPFADELYVYPAAPILGNASADHAVSFSIPVNTKGVITICRDHYNVDGDIRDLPFSSRFDEQDAYVIFDDVKVPTSRIFMDGDIEFYNHMVFNHPGNNSNITQQTCTRAAVKLEFAYDLCNKMANATNVQNRQEIAIMLGEIWSYAATTRAALNAALNNAHDTGGGAFFLDDVPMRAMRCMLPSWMTRVNDIIKIIGSHNLLATPSLGAFDNPKMGKLLREYMPGANDYSAEERAQIFRIAWDFAGSALGSRIELYERNYLRTQASNCMASQMNAQKNFTWNQVEDFMLHAGMK